MEKLRSLLERSSLLRYIIIGGVSYIIELAFMYAIFSLSSSYLLAVGISFWVGLIVSFLLQKIIAFRNKNKSAKKLALQAVFYGALVLVNYTFTLLFVGGLAIHIGLFVARTVALVITTGWNYFAYKHLIFRQQ